MAWDENIERPPLPGYINLFHLIKQERHLMGSSTKECHLTRPRKRHFFCNHPLEHHPPAPELRLVPIMMAFRAVPSIPGGLIAKVNLFSVCTECGCIHLLTVIIFVFN